MRLKMFIWSHKSTVSRSGKDATHSSVAQNADLTAALENGVITEQVDNELMECYSLQACQYADSFSHRFYHRVYH